MIWLSKLKINWEKLKEEHKQLRGFDTGYLIECVVCHKIFRTTNIDFIKCNDCAGKRTTKSFSIGGLR